MVDPLFTLNSVAKPWILPWSPSSHTDLGEPGNRFSVTMAFCPKEKLMLANTKISENESFLKRWGIILKAITGDLK